MQEENREGISGALKTLAAVVIVFLLLAALYVGYQAMQVLFPPNTYETALLATVEDTVDAEGVLLFEESYVAGGGTLGYLVADGERVSAGTAVAEIYSDAAQASLRQQLTQINDQIDLLQRSQNTTSVQLESLRKNRSAALYDLMDSLDAGDYEDTDAEKENYILAQNKLWVITGEVASFSDQIPALTQQATTVQSQLGNPSQITAPQTGYFIRSSSSGRLNAGSADILALDAANLKAYVESSPEIALDGCAGKIVSGFTWYYAGVCSAKQAEKLLGRDGKPLTKSVEIRFPGQVETPLKAKVSEVNIDAENDIARFVLSCEIINGDVLRLNCADAQIIVGRNTGLRVPAAAVHYLKEDGSEAEGQGENYIPGVYVKYGTLARFCRIDPVDDAHPQITDGDDLIAAVVQQLIIGAGIIQAAVQVLLIPNDGGLEPGERSRGQHMVQHIFGGHIFLIGDQRLKLRESHGDHAIINGTFQQSLGVNVLLQEGTDFGGIDTAVFQRGFDIFLEGRKGIEVHLPVDDFQKAFVLLREQIVIGGRLPKFRGLFTIALRQQRRIDGADGNTADDIKMITQFGKGAVCADLIGAFGTAAFQC